MNFFGVGSIFLLISNAKKTFNFSANFRPSSFCFELKIKVAKINGLTSSAKPRWLAVARLETTATAAIRNPVWMARTILELFKSIMQTKPLAKPTITARRACGADCPDPGAKIEALDEEEEEELGQSGARSSVQQVIS